MATQIKYRNIEHASERNKIRSRNTQILVRNPAEILIKEINGFRMRNQLAAEIENLGLVIKDCCPQCLKAHILKKSRALNLEKEARWYLNNLKCELGHNGFYLDNGKLMKV